ncbi:hypothetical protein LguiA_011003 [Lonicera macranthoides]
MSNLIVSKSSCNWHSFHEEAFIQFIEEEFDTGRMGINNTLSTKQVNEISQKLKEQTGRYFDAAQIRAKFGRMKAKTNVLYKLINSTGFGWSSETNTVTADENVWSTYLKHSGLKIKEGRLLLMEVSSSIRSGSELSLIGPQVSNLVEPSEWGQVFDA